MSIINPLLSRDVEKFIISFLDSQDQVNFSGVSKAAYKMLSNNEHFKGLFNKYSLFGQNEAFLSKKTFDKKFEHLCIGHPTNCWKVACSVFQTRNLKFSESIIDEEILIKHLKKKQLEDQAKLKEICGDSSGDLSSPIHQAQLAHEETKDMLKNDTASTLEKLIPGREDAFYTFMNDLKNLEIINEGLKKILDFDQRLLPYVNDIRYKMLEKRREEIVKNLKFVNERIGYFEPLALNDPVKYRLEIKAELKKYFYQLNDYFKCALEEQLLTIILEPEKLDKEDIHAFLSGFEAYRPLCEMHKEKQGTLENHALSFGKKSLPRLDFKHKLSLLNESIKIDALIGRFLNENEESDQQIISNINQISAIIDKELLTEFLEKYAHQPLTFELIYSQASIADTIHRKLKTISLDIIKESLARAIFNQNRAILTSETNTLTEPTPEEIEEAFATYIFETMIDSFASRPLENITHENYENYVNDIHCFFQELPLETINELLSDAVHKFHGDEGIKKITI